MNRDPVKQLLNAFDAPILLDIYLDFLRDYQPYGPFRQWTDEYSYFWTLRPSPSSLFTDEAVGEWS